jgi:superfamily II DNA or RNA helicase
VPPPAADAAESSSDDEDSDADEEMRAGLGADQHSGSQGPGEFSLRPYQEEAATLCITELAASGRAVLQMACRCGKTPVAYRILSTHASGLSLFLVPGLALLRQTAAKFRAYGWAGPLLCVGSGEDMTTSPEAIRLFVDSQDKQRPPHALIVATYQSSPLVARLPFGLVVFDECHRVCGGAAPRPFNEAHRLVSGRRLYMTATPVYDTAVAVNMRDRAQFGGVAYRYHMRQGIDAGQVNPFGLTLVCAGATAEAGEASAAQVVAAAAEAAKLLVFCRNIRHATALREAVQKLTATPCFIAHSRMLPADVSAVLRLFADAATERAIMFNVRLFQEGVEIPCLNGVMFAAPRSAPRDIIQSICRPLNVAAGKPPSHVFLPTVAAADPGRHAHIVPFIDALTGEDPALYERLLSGGIPWRAIGAGAAPPSEAGLRDAAGAAASAATHGAAAGACRLLRSDRVPWATVHAELRRTVTVLGRYPKTTDAWSAGGPAGVGFHRFYRWAADEYAAGRLEPYQRRQLEALPGWDPYGLEGPYPWRQCMDFLEAWLRDNGGVPPMVNVNNGGYVGLEATLMERLSGALTCVNQGDGKARKGGGAGFTISAEKRADLDRICGPHGLRWRKDRTAAGGIVASRPTFIQEAYTRFKAHYKEHGADSEYIKKWYPGYPNVHKKMENLEVQKHKLAPPRVCITKSKPQ